MPEKKSRGRSSRRSKRKSSESESDDGSQVKQIKREEVTSQVVSGQLAFSLLAVEDKV